MFTTHGDNDHAHIFRAGPNSHKLISAGRHCTREREPSARALGVALPDPAEISRATYLHGVMFCPVCAPPLLSEEAVPSPIASEAGNEADFDTASDASDKGKGGKKWGRNKDKASADLPPAGDKEVRRGARVADGLSREQNLTGSGPHLQELLRRTCMCAQACALIVFSRRKTHR